MFQIFLYKLQNVFNFFKLSTLTSLVLKYTSSYFLCKEKRVYLSNSISSLVITRCTCLLLTDALILINTLYLSHTHTHTHNPALAVTSTKPLFIKK